MQRQTQKPWHSHWLMIMNRINFYFMPIHVEAVVLFTPFPFANLMQPCLIFNVPTPSKTISHPATQPAGQNHHASASPH